MIYIVDIQYYVRGMILEYFYKKSGCYTACGDGRNENWGREVRMQQRG